MKATYVGTLFMSAALPGYQCLHHDSIPGAKKRLLVSFLRCLQHINQALHANPVGSPHRQGSIYSRYTHPNHTFTHSFLTESVGSGSKTRVCSPNPAVGKVGQELSGVVSRL